MEGKLRIEGEHRIRHENLPYELDCWYPLSTDITIPTLFLPISRRTARAVCRYYAFRFLHRDFPRDSGVFFSHNDTLILTELEHNIDSLLTKNADIFPNGAFLRLSGRSPKDADPTPDTISVARETYKTELHNLSCLYNYSEDDPVTRLMAIGRVGWMKIVKAQDAMSLLLTSERVFCDFADWLVAGTPEMLCFRPWCPDLHLDREFRLYVCGGRLNAISQYDHYGFYPHLLPFRKALMANLVGFWRDQVQPRFCKVSNYAVDLGVLCEPKDLSQEYKRENVVLLELSPFLRCTGAALFSWNSPEDVSVLCGKTHNVSEDGEDMPEMRIMEKPRGGEKEMVAVGWDYRWMRDVEDYKETYKRAVDDSNYEKWWFQKLWDWTVGWIWGTETFVFVCDGLKRGHIWHKRYLQTCSRFHVSATAEGFHISVDPVSGAPELVKNKPDHKISCNKVKGEVFIVENESLVDLDMFYNTMKGRHTKETITVIDETGTTINALAYILVNEPEHADNIEEFTLDMENHSYNPILHRGAVAESYIESSILTFDENQQ